MPTSDNQHRLNSRQRREIDQIGEKFHFNLAPPPSSLEEITTGPKFVPLTDFIEQFDWEYANLDIVDRRDLEQLVQRSDAAVAAHVQTPPNGRVTSCFSRVYSLEDARAFLSGHGLEVEAWAREVEGKFISAFVRANKPAVATCCAPGCGS